MRCGSLTCILCRRHRIDFRQPGMQERIAELPQFLIQSPPDVGIRCRQLRQPLRQGAEIQHGAADQQWQFAAAADIGHQFQGPIAELAGGKSFAGIDNIDQMMQ